MGRNYFFPGSYTIVVVDGDPQVCADLEALLGRAGYNTLVFHSGEDLLQSVVDWPDHACVIADVELPGMSGLDLIARLRRENVDAPVLILTRLGDVATAVRAMRGSVADYITKPYVERDLVNRLQNVLTRQAAAR